MKKVVIKEIIKSKLFINKKVNINKFQIILVLFLIILIWNINDTILKSMFIHYKNIQQKLTSNGKINKNTNYNGFETNIDLTDEFFLLNEVKKKLSNYNLTYIETITGYGGNIGNALIILNNLINICINIKCRNIIVPSRNLFIIK